MKFRFLFIPSLLALCLAAGAQEHEFEWRRVPMDNSRTGCAPATADNVPEAIGKMQGDRYFAPSGRSFKGGATARVAAIVLAAQPQMAPLKEVIAHSAEEMSTAYPESALSNWFVDELMRAVADSSGKKVDIGITNFGGIRTSMPKGDVVKDDIMSMFPFKNNLCYLELAGKDVRALLEQFAQTGWQVVGGARCVVKDNKLVSAQIDGAPLDDDKTYGVATISFLLNGGDDIFVARNAKRLDIYPEYIIDVMLPYVYKLTEEGKPIEYQTDGRIEIIKEN
mgnify:CR=1 FL=1